MSCGPASEQLYYSLHTKRDGERRTGLFRMSANSWRLQTTNNAVFPTRFLEIVRSYALLPVYSADRGDRYYVIQQWHREKIWISRSLLPASEVVHLGVRIEYSSCQGKCCVRTICSRILTDKYPSLGIIMRFHRCLGLWLTGQKVAVTLPLTRDFDGPLTQQHG